MNEILRKSSCTAFIGEGAGRALEQIEKRIPEGMRFLSEEARECLRNHFEERMMMVFGQVFKAEIQKRAEAYEPLGFLLGGFRSETLEKAARDLMADAGGQPEDYLQKEYPLIAGYQQQIFDLYVDCFSDFLQAFLLKKDEISRRFLNGKRITQILCLSTAGADLHRNGRCVTGVTTDAGIFYYKPHDCGLAVLYHSIVERWFSDCTVAADVVEGRLQRSSGDAEDKFAFVSCLKHEPVSDAGGVSRYYYHFGILAALFHGLGSSDIHRENILSCGDRPAVVDTETILGTAGRAEREEDISELQKEKRVLGGSLVHTGMLPLRTYQMPLISPLYSGGEGLSWLPEYLGQPVSVEGYESDFARGFREGYGRMLENRDEILSMIASHGGDAVRCILRNTEYYFRIRRMLFRPDHLREKAAAESVYQMLCSPYKLYGEETDREVTQHEWQCILKGDIPYFCTLVSGKDLCGESPEKIVRKDFFQSSVMKNTEHFLSGLSGSEEIFEQDLLRVIFDHALTDEEPEKEHEPAAGMPAEEEALKEEIAGLFRDIQKDAVRCMDGTRIWLSNSEISEGAETFFDLAVPGNLGMFAARFAESGICPPLAEEAKALAEEVCLRIKKRLTVFGRLASQKEKLHKAIPAGLYTGLGSVLLACRKMEQAGIGAASGLTDRLIQTGLALQLYRYKKIDAARGAAGLLLALSAAEHTEEGRELAEACGYRILEEELPGRTDLPYGCAGIGAALASAYELCKEPTFREASLSAFQKVKENYRPELSGWPDESAKRKLPADKGPHAAGIYLAAAYAKERLGEPETLLCEICGMALEGMRKEETLYRSDTPDEGNALRVLAFLEAGRKEEAGRILSAMLTRKKRKGCFTVTPSGIRSAFDPSFYTGTVGIGGVMMQYVMPGSGTAEKEE